MTVNGVRFELDRPLFVLATQNPIEQEGTYPLPEAQLDRFMFNVVIDYPTADEERRILSMTTGNGGSRRSPWWRPATRSSALHAVVRDVPAAENVIDYATRLVRATRPAGDAADERPSSSASGCGGAPGRAPDRRCCSAPRRARSSKAGASSRSTTSARSRCRSCGIACS